MLVRHAQQSRVKAGSKMTSEERAARAAERAAAKAAKRRANKEDWKFHPANANAKWLERQVN